jgi:hypothetical protein
MSRLSICWLLKRLSTSYQNQIQGDISMFAKPQAEHQWLEQLVGTWRFRHCCRMLDGSESTDSGEMVCRSLGGMWLLAESRGGTTSEIGPWANLLTVGYDTEQRQYVGTFIGSMMSNIWPYHGAMDESGKRLTLYSEGPKLDGSGVGKYRDTIEIVDSDNWLFISERQDDEGGWVQFMESTQTRCDA